MNVQGPARSSDRFDWAMGVLSALLMAGIIQDGWAHNHGKVDESFFTPWHFVLYGTMALNGIALLVVGLINLRRRSGKSAFRDSIPYGYWTSAIGVILFIIAGGLDAVWHTLFGIEVDINALVSPTHLALALAGAMVFAGPIRSVAYRYGPDTGGWSKVGPAVLAVAATLTLVGFFTQYAQPIGDDGIATVVAKNDAASIVQGIEVMNADGSSQTRLAPSTTDDAFGPSTSPDGISFVYRVAAGGAAESDLYVARVNGAGAARRITHSGRHDTQPAWSPDGRWIAFVSAPAGTSGDYQLDVVRLDGSARRTVFRGVTQIEGPAWSPDGARIAVGSRNGVTQEIRLVDVASGAATWLTNAQGDWPAWSSDGKTIYFAKTDEQGNPASISAARVDDSAVAAIIVDGATMPAVSTDGRRLAFVKNDRGMDQIFVAGVDGRGATDVSRLSGLDASRPAWTGRGRILFVATGRARPDASDYALGLSLSGVLIQSIVVVGAVLLIVRRWRAPIGAITAVMAYFGISMALQNDDYFGVLAATSAGILADAIVAVLGERARSGVPLYAIGFLLPFALTVLYVVFLGVQRGIGWPPNMVYGSPFIAGFAGLLVAFAFDAPLPSSRGFDKRSSG
jgi:Tol biopolymer transport system component